jgi:hypothetical protein
MIAFKEGESSTVSALNVLGRENFATLLNAFPTVSNFAIDLFSTIGFTSIYLIGVDLGFVDVKHHHSKSSGYYQENGEETYDFTKSANTSLIVPGNFRPRVNTKHEFKVSRQVIEQVTGAKPKGQEFYNCSDGARINGALPIRPDELLIVATEPQKVQAIEKLKTNIFSSKTTTNYAEKFESQFSNALLAEELDAFQALLEQEITSQDDVNNIINRQKEMLFTSYKDGKSLLFYYLYGTVNFANAVLTKLLSNQTDSQEIHNICILAKEKWLGTIKQIKTKLLMAPSTVLDISSFNMIVREKEFLKLNYKNEKFLIITDSSEFKKIAYSAFNEAWPWFKDISVCTVEESLKLEALPDYCLYSTGMDIPISVRGKINTLVISDSFDYISTNAESGITQFITPKVKENEAIIGLTWIAGNAIRACFNFKNPKIIVPKYWSVTSTPFIDKNVLAMLQEDYLICDYGMYICFYHDKNISESSSYSGSRGEVLYEKIQLENLLNPLISQEQFLLMKQKMLKKHFLVTTDVS